MESISVSLEFIFDQIGPSIHFQELRESVTGPQLQLPALSWPMASQHDR